MPFRYALLLVALLIAPAEAFGQRRSTAAPAAPARRAWTWHDLMRFRTTEGIALSVNGRTAALTAKPDRGDPEGLVVTTDGSTAVSVERGTNAAVSPDGRFVAFRIVPTLAAQERARRQRRDAPPNGLAVVDVNARRTAPTVPNVKAFAFAQTGRHLVFHLGTPERHDRDTTRADTSNTPTRDSLQRAAPPTRRTEGNSLVVRDLTTGDEATIRFVAEGWALSDDGTRLAYAVASRDSTADALYVRTLATGATVRLHIATNTVYRHLTWSKTGRLAFLAAGILRDGTPGPATLSRWEGGETTAARPEAPGWIVPAGNRLAWTDDGQRLFFGLRPDTPGAPKPDTAFAGFNPEAILAGRTMDVWHAADGRIQPQQKKRWADEQKRVWLAVLHDDGRIVRLDSADIALADVPQNAETGLQTASERYAREISWDGSYADVFAVDLATGQRRRLASHYGGPARLSPSGRYALTFDGEQWVATDTRTGEARRISTAIARPLVDEEHDTPDEAPPYGLAGFVVDGAQESALVYDRFDLWRLPLAGGPTVNVTGSAGRSENVRFRVINTDARKRFYTPADTLLLSAYNETTKENGLAAVALNRPGVPVWRMRGPEYVRFVRKAEGAATVLVTRETYSTFPDVWAVSGNRFDAPRRLTAVNPQSDSLRWGNAELVSWRGLDGERLEGVVIKPEGYDPARRYPVIVYFYELMSDRLRQFAVPAVSHRPALAQYVADGYVVFLPDIRYEVGRPGLSALKALVPGVTMLVERGLADASRIGLQGHSWGGYQAAWLATQTNVFRAIVAGAPVSNMTSAYGGIRWETGMSRQFQYEQTQSRLGATLWNGRDRYLDNSPLFFADRMNTPLLLIHGDEDGAVPWEQSIEYYLALRRLNKPVVFLQYRGEGHHPAQYANKLDWAMRMKTFFDVHLLGAPAPAWMEQGTAYDGR